MFLSVHFLFEKFLTWIWCLPFAYTWCLCPWLFYFPGLGIDFRGGNYPRSTGTSNLVDVTTRDNPWQHNCFALSKISDRALSLKIFEIWQIWLPRRWRRKNLKKGLLLQPELYQSKWSYISFISIIWKFAQNKLTCRLQTTSSREGNERRLFPSWWIGWYAVDIFKKWGSLSWVKNLCTICDMILWPAHWSDSHKTAWKAA